MEGVGAAHGDEKREAFAVCYERGNVGAEAGHGQVDQGADLLLQPLTPSTSNP